MEYNSAMAQRGRPAGQRIKWKDPVKVTITLEREEVDYLDDIAREQETARQWVLHKILQRVMGRGSNPLDLLT
jgi:hypothetical protein